MGLTLSEVHVLQRSPGSNQVVKISSNPYMRLVQQGEPPVCIQRGKFYSDGGVLMQLKNVPGWVRSGVSKLNANALKRIGLPPEGVDYTDPAVIPDEEPKPQGDIQNLEIVSEPMSIVDAVYSLDKAEDVNWTKDGMPVLREIMKLRGMKPTSREEVEELTSGYRRPEQEA